MFKEFLTADTTREWIIIIIQLCTILLVVIYIKRIVKLITFILNQIWLAITINGKLNIKELVGSLCLILFLLASIVFIFNERDVLLLQFIGLLLAYFCLMYGIERTPDIIKASKKNDIQ